MILPINHVADWRYICQCKQTQINKYSIRENTTRIDYDYRVGDQVIMDKKFAFKYETPFKGPYENFQTCTNGSVTSRMGAVTSVVNILHVKPCENN